MCARPPSFRWLRRSDCSPSSNLPTPLRFHPGWRYRSLPTFHPKPSEQCARPGQSRGRDFCPGGKRRCSSAELSCASRSPAVQPPRAPLQKSWFPVDLTLVNASIFNLPSSHRADVIVHGCSRDLQLWRPPGPDRTLWEEYGDNLQDVLDGERARLDGGQLEPGATLRLHPGNLHCDFLLLCALRSPHGETTQADAPNEGLIEQGARKALEFAGERAVARVAFPALGAGPGAAEAPARMAAVVRAAHAYKQACFEAGRPAGIEEVVVCDASGANVSRAKRLVARLARTAPAPAQAGAAPAAAPRKRKAATTRKDRGTKLDAEELAQARASASAYDRSRMYVVDEWLIHPKFGAGKVTEVDPERRIKVVFEDGKARVMIHAR